MNESAPSEPIPCPACGYDLRGTPGEACPECGTRFAEHARLAHVSQREYSKHLSRWGVGLLASSGAVAYVAGLTMDVGDFEGLEAFWIALQFIWVPTLIVMFPLDSLSRLARRALMTCWFKHVLLLHVSWILVAGIVFIADRDVAFLDPAWRVPAGCLVQAMAYLLWLVLIRRTMRRLRVTGPRWVLPWLYVCGTMTASLACLYAMSMLARARL